MLRSGSLEVSGPPYEVGDFWDEMFEAPDHVRPHYRALARRLAMLGPDEGARRQRAAELSFESRGITFAVNQGPDGVEKIMPFDLVPRLVQAEEWRRIETGLEQRIRAKSLPGRRLPCAAHPHDGTIPPELVLGARGYRPRCAVLTYRRRVHPRGRQRPRAQS
jgi:uncharacterized circularly permuted ATP-grasp superfamily protein